MSEDKQKDEQKVPLRKIILETDGEGVRIVLAEVSGKIEMVAILQLVINYLNKPTNDTEIGTGENK